MTDALRSAYVSTAHGARRALGAVGLLKAMERSDSRGMKWFRSLFAIYDLEDLSSLNLPWWTFDAVDAVEAFLGETPGARVFEWGSGASTIWLSRLGARVTAVEHDPDWAKAVSEKTAEFAETKVIAVPSVSTGEIPSGKKGFEGQYFDSYVRAIRDHEGPFDLIVIDGRAREACLNEAIPKLARGGYILFDDSNRGRYRSAIEASGLAVERLKGLAVCLPLPDATDLLSKPD